MTVPSEWEPFRVELRGATLRNVELIRKGRSGLPVMNVLDGSANPSLAARRACSWLHGRAPYRFDSSLAACDASECQRRGFTACADAAALAGAVAMLLGAVDVDAIVRVAGAQAHVVVVIDGDEVDPYAFRALPASVSSDAARWSLSKDVGPIPAT